VNSRYRYRRVKAKVRNRVGYETNRINKQVEERKTVLHLPYVFTGHVSRQIESPVSEKLGRNARDRAWRIRARTTYDRHTLGDSGKVELYINK
jgi:hypothetical protein